jgi:signal transduction histidine kinase
MKPRIQTLLSFSRLKEVFERGIRFFFRTCILPRSSNEDARRQEFILNTILCSLIAILGVLASFITADLIEDNLHYNGIPLLTFVCIMAVFMYLLLLSRSGYYRFASYTVVMLYFLSATYGAIRWGAELPLVAISYVTIIIISSILISTRFGFFVTLGTACTIIIITYLQLHQLLHPALQWKYATVSIHDPIQLSVFFLLISALSWLSNREMERSLRRARISEQALLEERTLLEIKVEERTKELKNIQKDKVAQLYRFAEFGKLSSGVFHDLMNSLNVVVANITQLERSPEHLPDVKMYVHKAVATSRRIGDYIALVRKQIAADDALSTFSLEKEITDAIDILHFRAREARVRIVFSMQKDITLHGNALKFYQIILNLLSNAIDACEDVETESLIDITVAYTADRQAIVLSVQDEGCGIDPTLIETVFNSFFTTKPYGKGIGLGLSQTKEIIEEAFKGTIAVSSTQHHGTTFIITLPLENDPLFTCATDPGDLHGSDPLY